MATTVMNNELTPPRSRTYTNDSGTEEFVDCFDSPGRLSSAFNHDDDNINGEEEKGEEGGIQLDSMLRSLFGIDFLPFHESFHGNNKNINVRSITIPNNDNEDNKNDGRIRKKEETSYSTLMTASCTTSATSNRSNPLNLSLNTDKVGELKQEDAAVPSASQTDIVSTPLKNSSSGDPAPPPQPAVSPLVSPTSTKKKSRFRRKKKGGNSSSSDDTQPLIITTPIPPPSRNGNVEEGDESMVTLTSTTSQFTKSGNKKKKNILKRAVKGIKKRTSGGNGNKNKGENDSISVSSAPVVRTSTSFGSTGGAVTTRDINDAAVVSTETTPIKMNMPSSSLPPEKQAEETLRLIRSDYIRIEEHKKSLSDIQSKAQETSARAAKISNNISTLSTTMKELHTKLNILEQNLLKEQTDLSKVMEELNALDAEQTKEENEIKRLKGVVDVRTDHMSHFITRSSDNDRSKRESTASYMTANDDDEEDGIFASPRSSYPSTLSGCSSIEEEDEEREELGPPLLPKLPSSPIEDDETLLLKRETKDGLPSPPILRKSLTCPPAIEEEVVEKQEQSKHARSPLKDRASSSFMRTHDLDIIPPSSTHSSDAIGDNDEEDSFLSLSSSGKTDNAEKKDIMPLDADKTPLLLAALAKMGYDCATDEGPRWTPTSDTKKIISRRTGGPSQSESAMSWSPHPWHQPYTKKEIFLWSGKFDHGGHGCDLPVIKTRGIIHTTAKNLVELIVDSGRVKEYNNMALGRTDEFIFQQGLDTNPSDSEMGIGGEAKLIRSLSKPPLIKKPLEFFNVMHARKLSEEKGEKVNGYVCVTRSVWENKEFADSMANGGKSKMSTDTTRSELLLGVNIMRDLEGEHEGWCELTTISHLNSPGVPLSLGRRIGLSAASNNIRSLQAIWE